MSITTNQSLSIDQAQLIYRIKQATFLVRAALLEAMQRKAGFRPDQPRVPAGNPRGGRWVDEDGDADLLLVQGDPNEFPEIPEDPSSKHTGKKHDCGADRKIPARDELRRSGG